MAKWLIASDIHGSAHYCRLLIEAFEREQAEKLVLLGDILYHGPRNPLPQGYAPKEVCALLNPLRDRILCVRGNCDAEVDQMVLDFPIMAPHMLVCAFGRELMLTHGHHLDELPAHGGTVIMGHTHIPCCERREGYLLMNPGSVSLPKGDSPRCYMTLDDGGFLWKTLEGEAYNSFK
ncbi:MAG: phosphodiesterase [Clostridia bacterium]|nr:phosphodiesterase [Clostridia bacterium]